MRRVKGADRVRPSVSAGALLALVANVGPLPAQEPTGLYLDSVDVNVVNVEVVVTDREGKPVQGLGREDFELLEDGRPVEISNFFAVAGGAVEAAGPIEELALLPRPETERLQLVVFVDERNIRPESRNRIFGDLRRYLEERLEPSDRVMLVAGSDRPEVVQPFTNDAGRLTEAIAEMERRVGRHVGLDAEYRSLMSRLRNAPLARQSESELDDPIFFDSSVLDAERLAQDIAVLAERRYREVAQSLDALGEFTRTLAGMRGRKAVLYVSDGLPLRAADALVEAWTGKYESWILQYNQQDLMRELTTLTALDTDATRDLRRLVAEANANRVAFYPLSTHGRRGTAYGSAELGGSGTVGNRGPGSLNVTALEGVLREDSLLRLAEGTGGRAFTRSGNIGGLMERMRDDFRNFYSLGFQRPPDAEPGEHEIEVRVRREGVQVRHLKSFRERDPRQHLQDLALSALHYGLGDNPLEVRLEHARTTPLGGKRYQVQVMVTIPFDRLLLVPQEAAHVGRVLLTVVAGDDRGRRSEPQEIALPIEIPNDRVLEAAGRSAGYPLELEMRAGDHRVTVGVRDLLARVDATASLDLWVGPGEEVAGSGS